eukprot:scaffold2720_cov123-Cylindrotheca_fusiformis.AAC.2
MTDGLDGDLVRMPCIHADDDDTATDPSRYSMEDDRISNGLSPKPIMSHGCFPSSALPRQISPNKSLFE